METDNILIIAISVVIAIILTVIFFRILLPIIVFLVIAYSVYMIITDWNNHRKYQY